MFIVSLGIFFDTLKHPLRSSHFISAKFNANEEIPLFSLISTGLGTCELWHFERNLGEFYILQTFLQKTPQTFGQSSTSYDLQSLLRPLLQHVPSNLRHNYLFDYSRCICKELTAKVFWLSLNIFTLTVVLHWKRFLWRKYLLLQISCVCLAWCRYVKFTYRKNYRRS